MAYHYGDGVIQQYRTGVRKGRELRNALSDSGFQRNLRAMRHRFCHAEGSNGLAREWVGLNQ